MDDEEMEQNRAENLERVLNSAARHRVIVAGPGTGKTFTFKKVLERVDGPALVLSFLGSLVKDLDRDLGDRATVRTFHAYCRGLLHNMDVPGITRGVDYFPHLALILEIDAGLIRDDVPRFAIERSFMYLDDSEGYPSTALRIGDYYNAVGHTDSVYRVYQALADAPGLIPAYEQILVDEYQDFSLLEVSLIAKLATASPSLIAGDDDQALYGFKHASADYLRDLVSAGEYEQFELPYCTRCTQVLVDATHRVVTRAQQVGLLSERLAKQYICYLPEKRQASERYPRIRYARCTVERNTAPYMCRFVAEQIRQIDPADVEISEEAGHPTVLVIAPTQFGRRVYQHLRDEGLPNVKFGSRARTEIEILDGYRKLVPNERSRLGWRLLLHATQLRGWEDIVRQALLDDVELADLIPDAFRQLHLEVVILLRRVLADEPLTDDQRQRLEVATGLPMIAIRAHLGLDEEPPEEQVDGAPTVEVTTLSGAKGLQAEHVYVVGLNEQHFPRTNTAPTDDEVCQLLVALTRARQSCTLVSCNRFGTQQLAQSVFVQWLAPLLETLAVNANYWNH